MVRCTRLQKPGFCLNISGLMHDFSEKPGFFDLSPILLLVQFLGVLMSVFTQKSLFYICHHKRYLRRGRCHNDPRGFTLIELLVVIFIIGILSAIALPTFLRLINKAKESEATQYISYLNKHQTAQYLEGSGFTNSFGTLSFPQSQTPSSAAGILKSVGFSVAETNNYLYGIKLATYNNNPLAVQVALSKQLGVQSYFGIVYIKDNSITCGPVALPVSLSSPVFQQLGILNNLISNPGNYCPQLFS
jgi:prepilin-type N-terminal cleavage/methylation domain-containing protein